MLVFVAVALSIAGFYLLCITDGFGSISLADILLVFTSRAVRRAYSGVPSILWRGGTVDAIRAFIRPVLHHRRAELGGFARSKARSTGPALLIPGSSDSVRRHRLGGASHYLPRVVGQQWVPPTRASLLMSLRIVLLSGRRCVAFSVK